MNRMHTMRKVWEQVPVKLLLVILIFLSSLFLFAWIANEVVYEQEDTFDRLAYAFIMQHSSPALVQSMEGFTFLGSTYFLLPAYVALVLFFIVNKRKRYAIDISIVGLSSLALMLGLKEVFKRKRPDLPIIQTLSSYSFPSGHALSAFVFCSILVYLIYKSTLPVLVKALLIMLLFLLAAIVGISRIVLNVHYATDVIAAFCLGVMWVILSFWVLRKMNAWRNRQKSTNT